MPKKLIICSDGTWQTPDQEGGPTNVVKMARAILPRHADGTPQMVYYDEGVGTGGPLDRVRGGLLGIGLWKNVQDSYRFLVDNYEPGDEILLFGYSRGAYTVRSLAGLIGLVGIARKSEADKFDEIYAYYRTPPSERGSLVHPRDRTSVSGKENPSWVRAEPDIQVLGVWDTVGHLGIPYGPLRWIGKRRYDFHDMTLGGKVRHAYQALAIDERRMAFKPTMWENEAPGDGQVLEQVWFAGTHAIGGGCGDECRALSDQAFTWMVDRVRPHLSFDEEYVARKAANVRANIKDARSGPWRLLPAHKRKIGAFASERVHPSVWQRLDSKQRDEFVPHPYAPENLSECLTDRSREELTAR